MNLRCFYCQTPFTLGRAEILAALQRMDAETMNHYDAHCPRCRRANSVSRQRLEIFYPNWREAATEQEAAPATMEERTPPMTVNPPAPAIPVEVPPPGNPVAKPAKPARKRAGSGKKDAPAIVATSKAKKPSATKAKPAAKPKATAAKPAAKPKAKPKLVVKKKSK